MLKSYLLNDCFHFAQFSKKSVHLSMNQSPFSWCVRLLTLFNLQGTFRRPLNSADLQSTISQSLCQPLFPSFLSTSALRYPRSTPFSGALLVYCFWGVFVKSYFQIFCKKFSLGAGINILLFWTHISLYILYSNLLSKLSDDQNGRQEHQQNDHVYPGDDAL